MVIARGNISFPARYGSDTFVAFTVSMNEQKILHMTAGAYSDRACTHQLDSGTAEIVIATDLDKAEARRVAPKNAVSSAVEVVKVSRPLDPTSALNNLAEYCRRVENARRNYNFMGDSENSRKAREEKEKILAASNHAEFAEPLLRVFAHSLNTGNEELKRNCEVIGRKIGEGWTAAQKRQLAALCMQEIQPEILDPTAAPFGASVQTKAQAIFTLSMCASDSDLEQLSQLVCPKFKVARLYTHAITKTSVDWIYGEFLKDCRKKINGAKAPLQESARALGVAFRLNDPRKAICSVSKAVVVKELIKIISSRKANSTEVIACVLAIGQLCDQRYTNDLDARTIIDARNFLAHLGAMNFAKSREVALKMIDGAALTADEEELLLIKID